MEFKDSQTKTNLMKAFAGESQARNRYEISASVAKKQNLHELSASSNALYTSFNLTV